MNLPETIRQELSLWTEQVKGKRNGPLARSGARVVTIPHFQSRDVLPTVKLTATEVMVVKLIATGLCNKTIASEMGISIKTVEKHRQEAMVKTGYHSPVGLTHVALCNGLVTMGQVVNL